jgi:tetratricopeptide (TPR) repeat protein
MKRYFAIYMVLLLLFPVAPCFSQKVSSDKELSEMYYGEAAETIVKERVSFYATEGTIRKLISLYHAASDKNAAKIGAWVSRACCHSALKEYDQSFVVLDSARLYASDTTDKRFIDLWYGYTLEEKGDSAEAMKYYNKALEQALKIYGSFEPSLPVAIDIWECMLPAKGVDVAEEYFLNYLSKIKGISEKEKESWSKLATRPVARVMGRKWDVHSKAAGVYIVSESEMEELRLVDKFYKSVIDEIAKDTVDMAGIIDGSLSEDLIKKASTDYSLIWGADIKELKEHYPASCTLFKSDEAGYYEVKYYAGNYESSAYVHVARTDSGLRIDKIVANHSIQERTSQCPS